jgi:hypothetical protein
VQSSRVWCHERAIFLAGEPNDEFPRRSSRDHFPSCQPLRSSEHPRRSTSAPGYHWRGVITRCGEVVASRSILPRMRRDPTAYRPGTILRSLAMVPRLPKQKERPFSRNTSMVVVLPPKIRCGLMRADGRRAQGFDLRCCTPRLLPFRDRSRASDARRRPSQSTRSSQATRLQ